MTETDRLSAAARRPWRVSTQTVVIGQVALLLIVIAALSAISVWREYDTAVARAEIQARNAAQTASEHVRWLLEASSQALRRVDDLLKDTPDSFEAGGIGNLSDTIAALPLRLCQSRSTGARSRSTLTRRSSRRSPIEVKRPNLKMPTPTTTRQATTRSSMSPSAIVARWGRRRRLEGQVWRCVSSRARARARDFLGGSLHLKP
jgi:hypothetical protein